MIVESIFEKLYTEHKIELNRKVRNFFGESLSDHEDLVHEAFSNILSHQDIDKIEFPKAYLLRSAINIGLNYRSRFKNTQNFLDDTRDNIDEPLCTQSNPEDLCSMHLRIEYISDAMNTLTDKQRDLVVRNRIHGETYQQIHIATGFSLGDISRQMQRATEQLHQYINTKNA
ncbi:sigma-70 family RNA polymerase sigma factor [Pseudoalteromonas sp. MMG006]|uniref:RNA polymerase sigma factor n=1 Tax=unclassified Pseudoalteromonas TaxID=194690 RepID=UPI001B35F5F6|nr:MULTISPECIES: sigma-70 family RNA polymerase sigma factor [unclassified Pseudoalteromonas]MBQ4800342.1 sigma-70 family RNA polymerase sigma factor [Pseudoalteromonas sp. MMG006]MBQ4859057.1 sigma-70 family RNA polymerase sigma factor [Pseudoalteromonas sp. MMG007]